MALCLASTSGRLAEQGHGHASSSRAAILRPQFRKRGSLIITQAQGSSDEPDWEAEMSIFKQRTLKPSQLETLRKFQEDQVDVGRVLYCQDSLAIVEGLNNDAEVGTALSFSSGARGVMLWRRSDNVVFALLLGGADLVSIGDGVECKVKGILQVVDEKEGPSTKRDYAQTLVPVGKELRGRVVDYLGRPCPGLDSPDASSSPSSSASSSSRLRAGSPEPPLSTQLQPQLGTDQQLPMLNVQVDMESREQIAESLLTGVKAVDALTPVGRGQAQLVAGPTGSGKTQLCIDAVLGQAGTGVRCVYAAVGSSREQLGRTVAQLRENGCLEYTTVVAATADRPLGEQYAAMLTAVSIGEQHRDEGGHALVVLNDVSVMVRMWEQITVALADLGPVELDLPEDETPAAAAAAAAGAGPAGAASSSETAPGGQAAVMESEEQLVEYEGMLVSVAAAQRRRFFSSLIQRAAKMHRRLRGGSLSLLLVVPGVPARGVRAATAKEHVLRYKHLSEDQKAKLLRALEKAAAADASASGSIDGGASSSSSDEGSGSTSAGSQPARELRTEVVEELMSIADGQVVLQAQRDAATGGVSVDPQLSVSRIGSRAYHPAMEAIAPQVRLDLAQAADAQRFATDRSDPAVAQALKRAQVVTAALPQPPRTVCRLEEQVVHLLALQKGLLDNVPLEKVHHKLAQLTASVRQLAPEAMREVASSKRLTAASEAALVQALQQSSEKLIVRS